ncbi:MAG TPA: bestrophin family ion channel [Edaphobacter sp.]|nr:bestrophin family ion channel [Edaphobacter sp.]
MIVPTTPQLKRMVQYVGFPLLLLVAWDVLVVLAFKVLRWEWLSASHLPLALYGSAIGIIVGFRNNSAYARWWEARTIWGQIVNESRSLGRQLSATMSPNQEWTDAENAERVAMQWRIVHYQIAFVHALRRQLRGFDPVAEVRELVPPEEYADLGREKNIPLALQVRMGASLREARHRGWIDSWEWQSLDRTLNSLTAAQGGAERIKNTPMPKQYNFFPMLFVQIYCLMLPIGMVENLGWFTPLGSTVVGFMFLALDKIGRDLENPFDNKIYDVPMTAITKTIEINLRQMLGETELPESITPVRGVLW